MELRSLEAREPAFIPLRDAMLCLDCQFITPAGSDTCSLCGSHLLLGVAQILVGLLEMPREASRLAG